MYRRYRKQSFR